LDEYIEFLEICYDRMIEKVVIGENNRGQLKCRTHRGMI
jgi:hypothetical protein